MCHLLLEIVGTHCPRRGRPVPYLRHVLDPIYYSTLCKPWYSLNLLAPLSLVWGKPTVTHRNCSSHTIVTRHLARYPVHVPGTSTETRVGFLPGRYLVAPDALCILHTHTTGIQLSNTFITDVCTQVPRTSIDTSTFAITSTGRYECPYYPSTAPIPTIASAKKELYI